MKALHSQDEEINHSDNGLILLKPTLCPNLGKMFTFSSLSPFKSHLKDRLMQNRTRHRCRRASVVPINIKGETLFVPSMQKDDQSPYLTVFSLAALKCEYNH